MKTKVYLAGGMKSNWQTIVMDSCIDKKIKFINPQKHGLSAPEHYTFWDLYGVSKCDILFGFMGKDNPSGFGLAAEIGYAKALRKTIILCDEKSVVDENFKKMYGFINEIADVRFNDLKIAIDYLKSFKNI